MSKPFAIIFDLDDTLFDHCAAMESFLRAEFGLDGDELANLLQADARGQMPRDAFCEEVSRAAGVSAESVWRRIRGMLGGYAVLEHPEVLEGLSNVAQLAVLTNGGSETQRAKLEALNIARWVDRGAWYISEEIGVRKPAPAAFETVLTARGFSPDATLFVGNDLVCDIAGAAAVGMQTCWVARGATISDTPHPDWTIDTIAGLPKVWSEFST